MEDTDEDFFDKLVDDVDIVDSVMRNESENVSRVNEVVKVIGDNGRNLVKELEKVSLEENVGPTQSLVSASNVNQRVSSGGSGVKEVQWSAFSTEDTTDSNVFGTYNDDFFTEFDGNLVEPSAKNDNFVASEVSSVDNVSHGGSVIEYSNTTSARQSVDTQDVMNSREYWENMCPGWKYDVNTGQWYQVGEGYDAALNPQVSGNVSVASDWTVSGVKTEVSYLQQNVQNLVAEKGVSESVVSWSPNSQTSHANESVSNNGYPPHMYFDPQYPGWYYDMNLQQWCGLDMYHSTQTNQNSNQGYNWNASYNNQHVQSQHDANLRVDNNNFNQQQQSPYGYASQSYSPSMTGQSETMNATNAYVNQDRLKYAQQNVHQTEHQKSYRSNAERSSAGQPRHALVTFGFGGKLIVMKDTTADTNISYGGQKEASGGVILVHNLAEVVTEVADNGTGVRGYFHTLCRQSFPGPLAGGNVGSKELNRWIDERITHPSDTDYKRDQTLKLLLSLLKIASQHYGKLRSPFGTDTTSKENDAPDIAVARLFASAKKSNAEYGNYGAFANCLQQLPSEGRTRATAAEVQTLLVSGRKMEALYRAQEGQLWGLALVLAAQLGDQFYADTVRQMALRQIVAGSPLRTLCLLIAGQPADVFSNDTIAEDGTAGGVNMFQAPAQAQLGANTMLDNWEENLAMITANRTKDDELVLIHLGDCLWKDTSNIIAAHICYLVAEANFERYSDSARLCLIGADHWKHPRTYASPEAIQRTELYEYSKLLGNSQFTLLPFQPYKLIYANMLAEVGRVSDSLKYCQVISRSLKIGRASEVDTWRHMVLSLEDRIKTYQQGGFSTNLAPGKLVGKLRNLIDSTAHRVVGGLPPPVPSTSSSSAQNEHNHQPTGPRVSSSQSTMAMSSLVPSASMEPISQKATEGNNRRIMHNRSVSEPDFSRSPRQVDTSKENSPDSQSKASGTSRFRRFGFGSQLFQKMGLVLKPRQDKQAKLGETNKFYYDDKLKRWVEEGVDPPAEEAALAPPPTMGNFQNGTSDYGSRSSLKSEGSVSNGSSEYLSGNMSVGHSSGIPPLPATSSQFSARGKNVRARYVDTFNQGGGNPTKLFQSPSVASTKPVPKTNPKFFVPMAAPSAEQPADSFQQNIQEQTTAVDDNHPPTSAHNSFQAPTYQSSMQRFASMDNITKGGMPSFPSTSGSPHSRRTASWGGSTDERFSVSNSEMKPHGEVLGMHPKSFLAPMTNGDASSDDFNEVEL
ncbi:ancestral coatomer element 1, Sec16/Sec31 [Artemisia annua]|uniref:Protein transport protein sec16 n=1 Tax=Artemisia annua TaxID=35608 RepID=A0A2U1MYU3_ARTAN|nr:ancestral coatomer element 1, Sec16/Sec31 [Artemisia annua]